jgi:hydroxyacylglutathione hydrolase
MVYHFAEQSLAFVGDTLFAMGCGRVFEGTPEQMWSSLETLMAWPDETVLYCAHEYTQSNAQFAISIEPDNPALQERKYQVDAMRANNENTVPTNLGLEKLTNPFLRPDSEEIRTNLDMANASMVEVFTEIRKRKDNF